MTLNSIRAAAVLMAALSLSCSSTRSDSDGSADGRGMAKPITSQFKMLSINVQHGLKDNTGVRKFSDWVKSTGAELVAVQQIIRATDSKPGFDAYSELLRRLDMRGTFAKARYYQGWDSGNALFCLYPLLQSNTYPLPTGKGKTRRSVSFGIFEMGLQSTAFVSTDLDADDLTERVKQVYELLAIQKSMEEMPMIVTGNFGESTKGKGSAKMLEQFISANSAADQTAALNQHIYLPSNGKWKVLTAEKAHYPALNVTGIVATIEVTQ